MAVRYQIPNQITGISDHADTYTEALEIQKKNIDDYVSYSLNKPDGLFDITIMIENSNGTITQRLCDENGNPMPTPAELQFALKPSIPT